MKDLVRLVRYVLPWWKPLAAGLACTMLFAIFSGISIGIIVPFTKLLFEKQVVVVQATEVDDEEVLFSQLTRARDRVRSGFPQSDEFG